MIPQRWIEAYLRVLLEYSRAITLLVVLLTGVFSYYLVTGLRLHTDFLDFYPKVRTLNDAFAVCRERGGGRGECVWRAVSRPGMDPYIQIYYDFREMFGSANILSVILEVKEGAEHKDIYNPDTLQKLDEITKYIIQSKGVNPTQIFSIAHKRVKSITTRQGSIQVREIFYPAVPQTQADADRVRFAVYSTKGVRGIFTALDDTAAVVHAGFWEEEIDFKWLFKYLNDMRDQFEDENHTIYITGFPWLYTSVLQYANQVLWVFSYTFIALAFLLWVYFRTWTGIWVPLFSGVLSSVWGLGIAVMLGFNLDPLVLVIPVFLTARALSHSVQSMDRYHEEYHRTGDKDRAIVDSYSHLFPPAIASLITDGIGLLVVAVAPIPLIQKVAIFASFWVVSIFISVVTLHPIILKVIDPPPEEAEMSIQPPFPIQTGMLMVAGVIVLSLVAKMIFGLGNGYTLLIATLFGLAPFWYFYADTIYPWTTNIVIQASEGAGRWLMILLTIALFIGGWGVARTLKVGDMTPGAALLFPDHPYNVAYAKLNDKFLGANQLIVIADTLVPDGIKDSTSLTIMDEFATYMEGARGASGSLTVVEIVKQLARLYRDGDPKWGVIPDNPKEIGQLFYIFESAAAGDGLSRFMDPSGRYGTVLTLFRDYSNEIIAESIEYAQEFTEEHGSEQIEFRFAGGLFGILASVNKAVENSYWTNLILIWSIVYVCLYLTYGNMLCCGILMIPVVLSQIIAEALMVMMEIDLNVNSLPIAAAGAGVGVDYGIYHFSRMVDCINEMGDLDEAVDYATATTGKAIIFTSTTMIAGTIFWWFSDLKFQAEMGFLLALLMSFNTFGGLVIVPAFVKAIRPPS